MLADILGRRLRAVVPPEAQFLAAALTADLDAASFLRLLSSDRRFALWGVDPSSILTSHDDSVSSVMERLVLAYARREAECETFNRWIDHTPSNIHHFSKILDAFPNGKIIHLVRDPRAVVASVLPLDWGPSHPKAAARWWMQRTAAGLAAESMYPTRVVRVRYEDLVLNPEETLYSCLNCLGVESSESGSDSDGFDVPQFTQAQHALVGHSPDESRVNAWRKTLTGAEQTLIKQEVGDTAAAFGYDVSSSCRVSARARASLATRSLVRVGTKRVRYRWRRFVYEGR
ncbi:MAG: hypothetical protein CMH83_18640 [Nocardioides sp.]|nr:hypothetical protein [Nocardioides sp.]